MEGLRSLAQSIFNAEQKFLNPPPDYQYDAVELRFPDHSEEAGSNEQIQMRGSKRTKAPILSLNQEELCNWLASATRSREERLPGATLRLVRIRRELDVSLVISQASFTRIFDSMKADPLVKYMICRDYDGYDEYSTDGFRLTRFIGTSLYALAWTFDPDCQNTTVLFLDRRRQSFPAFVDVLWEYRDYIQTPSLLCFVSCYFLLQFYDRETGSWELETIRHIEAQTGFGVHPSGWRGLEPLDLVEKFNINQLTSWLQAVNEIASNTANRVRHLRQSRTLLDTIRQENEKCEQHGIPGHALERYRNSLGAIGMAVPSIERHMSVYIEYLSYFMDRSERLSRVLFALLTHEDAEASIGLAAASKSDSSSMKTIAVMTMAFLPATFFAALFSVPSLQGVVRDDFWVYWAFTLPTTVAIFLVWLLIAKRKGIRRKAADLYCIVKPTAV